MSSDRRSMSPWPASEPAALDTRGPRAVGRPSRADRIESCPCSIRSQGRRRMVQRYLEAAVNSPRGARGFHPSRNRPHIPRIAETARMVSSFPLKGLNGHGSLNGARRSHVRLLVTSQFATPRSLGAHACSLGRHRRFSLRRFVYGVDLPLMRAVYAGIDQRSANVMVEPFAVGLTDRTFDDGRGYGSHHWRRTFLHRRERTSRPHHGRISWKRWRLPPTARCAPTFIGDHWQRSTTCSRP